ncbi:hypothetical protein YC2023_024578 [Brassica napus]
MDSKGGKKKSRVIVPYLMKPPLVTALKMFVLAMESRNSNLLIATVQLKSPIFFLLIPNGVYGLSAIVFEGYEKRLEVSFFEPSIFQYSKGRCALTKSQLDEILTCMHARCVPFLQRSPDGKQ